MKTKLKTLIILVGLFVIASTAKTQVTIGSSSSPSPGSLLDLKEHDVKGANSSKGLLLPRVLLQELGSLAPAYTGSDSDLIKGHIGLIVFNMTDDLDKGLCKGVYLWRGSAWVRVPKPCAPLVDPELINTPNCYIVASGAAVSIPIGKPYLVWGVQDGLEAINVSDKVSTELLWQDKPNLIRSVTLLDGKDLGPNSSLSVATNPSVKGNALVAVRIGPKGDSTDPIRWSWHIWVADTPQGYSTTNEEGAAYTFMDRNLGAINTNSTDAGSIGLVYQWGRKDPFPGPLGYGMPGDLLKYSLVYNAAGNPIAETTQDGIQHVAVADESNLTNSIKHPKNYYFNSVEGALGDWYTLTSESGQNNNLWMPQGGGKSVYDPCPAGWRIPESRKGGNPWGRYFDDGFGWGDSLIESVGYNGFNVGGGFTGAPALGFYPLLAFKNGETYTNGGPGGIFYYPSSVVNSRPHIGAYWTADSSGETSKYGNTAAFRDPAFGFTFNFLEYAFPRATGLPVRCVKE